MRVNRGFLYWGVFLVALGGVLVAGELGALDPARVIDALRLWPLAVVAVGVGLVLRRTRLSLSGGMLAAAVPGLVLGGAFAVGPRFVGNCGGPGEAAPSAPQQGTFDGPASVSVATGCGSLTVSTAPGSGWRLDAGNTAGHTPTIRTSPQSLSIESTADEGWGVLSAGRNTWNLTLPTSPIDRLNLVVNAGESHVALPAAQIARLAVTGNASLIAIDASSAAVTNLLGTVNVGSLSIHLPANSDLTGSLRVRGGQLQICAPTGLGLRLTSTGQPRQVKVDGLQQAGSDWQSPDYETALHHADLEVSVNVGGVEINPIGGCR
ncbi:MAG TPA: hypothetical protein VIM30_06435 [Candidatus Limnocylindrales bacterium]|jgi:hypothetical protein